MKRFLTISMFLIIMTSCSPSNQQIERAIALTQEAIPTYTATELATLTETPTPTITTSPTPEVQHIDGLLREDILMIFENNGFVCGDWEINENGYYGQSCSQIGYGSVPDSIISGKISGRSENTIFTYSIMFVPFTTFSSWGDLERMIKSFVEFGQDPRDNIAWVDENFKKIENSENFVEKKNYFDSEIILSNTASVVLLMITASE